MLKTNVDSVDWAWGGVHRSLDHCCRRNAAGQTEGLHMQDPKHCAKTFDNLAAVARVCLHGKAPVHGQPHMERVSWRRRDKGRSRQWGVFFGETGLQAGDVKRQDRQSVMAAVRRSGWKLLRALGLCKHQTLGTETHLDINQRFFRTFLSERDSLEERAENAAYIIAFLKLWRHDVHDTKGQGLGENFLTCQCHEHMMLACCQAMLMILTFRDEIKDSKGQPGKLPCHGLARTGSDCCERCFSE